MACPRLRPRPIPHSALGASKAEPQPISRIGFLVSLCREYRARRNSFSKSVQPSNPRNSHRSRKRPGKSSAYRILRMRVCSTVPGMHREQKRASPFTCPGQAIEPSSGECLQSPLPASLAGSATRRAILPARVESARGQGTLIAAQCVQTGHAVLAHARRSM
jgi:hypothetical protein